jgi:hypothetical protein
MIHIHQKNSTAAAAAAAAAGGGVIQPAATRLEFDRNGKLSSSAACARGVGTTVAIKELFGPLPVRRQVRADCMCSSSSSSTQFSQAKPTVASLKPWLTSACSGCQSGDRCAHRLYVQQQQQQQQQ